MHNIHPYGRNSHISIQQTFLWYFLFFIICCARGRLNLPCYGWWEREKDNCEGGKLYFLTSEDYHHREGRNCWLTNKMPAAWFHTKFTYKKIHLFCYQQTNDWVWKGNGVTNEPRHEKLLLARFIWKVTFNHNANIYVHVIPITLLSPNQSGHSTVETRPRKTPF